MTERALPFDDEHIRVLTLERVDDSGFHLTRAELRRDRIKRHSVAGPLDQAGLTGAHQHRLHTVEVQGAGQDGGCRALADGAVGAQHGNSRARDLIDTTAE